MSDRGALERLAALAEAQGGLLAAAVRPPAAPAPGPGALAAAGPRAHGRAGEYELLVEAIREGQLLHHACGRVVVPDDPDLALLAGDWLYAAGLARLAELGDLEAVAELADVVSLCAQAQAAGESELLVDAVWDAGAAAIGWGADPALARAKASARADEPEAVACLHRAARRLRAGEPPR